MKSPYSLDRMALLAVGRLALYLDIEYPFRLTVGSIEGAAPVDRTNCLRKFFIRFISPKK